MLVELTPNEVEIERRMKVTAEHGLADSYTPQHDPKWRLDHGIYQANCPFNFPHEEFLEFKRNLEGGYAETIEEQYELFAPTYEKSTYGVADNIEQIKEYYKEEIADPVKKYFIYCTGVRQDPNNKYKGGGWRWHKWGPYIGKLDSKYEYLDDEDFGPDFEYIIVFSINPVTG